MTRRSFKFIMEHNHNEQRLTDQGFGHLDQEMRDDPNLGLYEEPNVACIQAFLNQHYDDPSEINGQSSGNPTINTIMNGQNQEARLTNQSFGHSDNQSMADPNLVAQEQTNMACNPMINLLNTLERHGLSFIDQRRTNDNEIDNLINQLEEIDLAPIQQELDEEQIEAARLLEVQEELDRIAAEKSTDEGITEDYDFSPQINYEIQDIDNYCNPNRDERIFNARGFVETVLLERAIYGYRDFLAALESRVRVEGALEVRNRDIFLNFIDSFHDVDLTLLTRPNRFDNQLPQIYYMLNINEEKIFIMHYGTFVYSDVGSILKDFFREFCDSLFEDTNIRSLNLRITAQVLDTTTILSIQPDSSNDQTEYDFGDNNNGDDRPDRSNDDNDFMMYDYFRRNRFLEISRRKRSVFRWFQPQGDMNPTDTAEAGSSVQSEQSIGVELVENRGDTHAIPADVTPNPLSTIPYGMPSAVFPDLTSRWNNLDTFQWTTAQEKNSIIKEYKLPIDVVVALGSNPALLPLLQYNFYRPEMTFRFQPNTTNFHQGRLIVGMMYYPRPEYNQASSRTFTDARQLVQLDFATINASGSNIAEVKIPFKSYLDMIPVREGKIGSSQYYASIFVGVLSPLQIGEGGSQSISVATQVQFECEGQPTHFFGQQTRRVLQAQGLFDLAGNLAKASPFGGAISRVESLLGGLGAMYKPSRNCDKPVDPTEAQPVVQYMVPSLSWGDGPSVGRVMRLRPNNLTPFEPTITPTTNDELTVENITRKWGYVDSFTITTDTLPGTIVQSIPISPIDFTSVGRNILPTPLAGVASMFSYWSGTIEYKFLVIKANPQSLRLRFIANPGNAISDTDRAQMVDYHSTVVDFQELTEATYSAPWMGPSKMLPVTQNGIRLTTGFVQVRLETSLVSIPTCAMNVEVLVFQRAGAGMELSIPRSTFFEPDIDRPLPPASYTMHITKPEFGILFAWVFDPRTIVPQDQQAQALTYGLPEELEFSWTDQQVVVLMISDDDLYAPGQCTYRELLTQPKYVGRILFAEDPRNDTTTFRYSAETPDGEHIRYVGAIEYPGFEFENSRRFPYEHIEIDFPVDGDPYPIGRLEITPVLRKGVRVLQPQSEEREAVAGSLIGEASSLVVGEKLLGESFDLRTTLRRYQHFATIDFTAPGTGFYALSWDVNAGLFNITSDIRRVTNMTWMHDSFRFYRGSMNYQIVPIFQTNPNQKFMITHIPAGDNQTINDNPNFLTTAIFDDDTSFFSHEFTTDGTRTIPVTVPNYNYVNYLVNGYNSQQIQDPRIASTASYRNGSIQLRTYMYASDRVILRLERAMADDASFYVFQGFPLCAVPPGIDEYTETSGSTALPSARMIMQPQCEVKKDFKPRYPLSGLIVAMQQEKRRGQKAIRKFFRSLAVDPSTMSPQDNSARTLSEEESNLMVNFSHNVVIHYTERRSMARGEIPQFILNEADEELEAMIENICRSYDDEERHFIRISYVDLFIYLANKFSNLPEIFFNDLHISRKSDSILTRIKNSVVNATATIPAAMKEHLTRTLSGQLGLTEGMFTALKATLEAMCKATSTNIFFILSQVQMIWKASDAWVKGFAMCNLLASFGLLNTRHLGLAFVVCELIYLSGASTIQKNFHYHYQAQGEVETPKCVIEWTAALIGGIAATAGLASAPTWGKGISAFARDLSTTTNSWYTVLTKSGTFITDYILYLFGCEEPQAVALAELKRSGADVESWAQNVLAITRPETRDMVLGSPMKRQEICRLYQEGSIFLRAILTNKDRPEQVSSFLTIWRDLADLYKHTGEVPNSIEANTQPICIWLEGPPGVGKSACAKQMAIEIAKLMGIHYDGDPFFVRQCGRKYWDGWHGQPIVIIDDALQVRSAEADAAFLEDYYGLLTEAAYSPEFAKTEEKTKIVTPKILIICSNLNWPNISVVPQIEAFYRRRDFMFHVALSPEIQARGIKHSSDIHMTKEMFKDNDHLTFEQYLDPSKSGTGKGSVMRFYPMIKALKTRLDHLVESRRRHASDVIAMSMQLHPEAVMRTREELLEKLSNLNTIQDLVSSVTSGLSESTQQAQMESFHEPEKPAVFEPREECVCRHGCLTQTNLERKEVRCFCEFHVEANRIGREFRYCMSSGMYCVADLPPKFGFSQIGECSDCPQLHRDEAHDSIRAQILQDAERDGISALVTLPAARIKPVELVKPGPIKGLKSLAKWFKLKAKSMLDALPWKYILPLVLSLGVFYVCKAFAMIDKAKDLLNIGKPKRVIKVDLESQPIPQMASSGSVQTAKGGKAPVLRHLVATPQDNTDNLIQRVQRNKVKIAVRFEDGTQKRSMGLGICDRYIVFPHHIFSEHFSTVRGVGITLCGPHNTDAFVELKRDDLEIVRINNLDLCLVKLLNRVIPQFKDLRKSVVKSKDLARVSRRCLLLDYGTYTNSVLNLKEVIAAPVKIPISYLFDGVALEYNLVGYEYSVERAGMCGSILIDSKTNMIVGFHTTGDPGNAGYATMIVQDHFAELNLSCEGMEEPELEAGGSLEPKGEFIPIGKLVDAQCVTLPIKSQITRSVSFGVLTEPVRVPVKLATVGESKPGLTNLTLAVEKGGKPTLNFDLARVKEVADHTAQEIIATCKPVCSGVGRRSVEEAIVGRVGVPFQEALKRNTSVGWPLSTLGIGTKKSHFVDYLETSDGLRVKGLHPELAKLYDVNHAKRREGIIPFSPYQNFLKDERLKPGKKPRLINGCPLDQVIEFRRYMMDFVSALQSNGMEVGIGVGMNVHGMEWSRLTNKLLGKGSKILCGDYSGFGPGLNTELVMRCCDIVNEWYEKYQTEGRERLAEDAQVRRTLFENLAFSHEVNLDTLILTLCGSPSGNPGTAPINSLVARMYIKYMWLEVFLGTVFGSLRAMMLLIFFCVYGDDLIMAVPDFLIEMWNNEVLQHTFARFGIKYTDADKKSGDIRKYTSIEEATFLKCHFRKHPVRGEGVWLAALEKPMIEDIPNWIRKSNLDWELASLANCIESARLSYAWGIEYFEDICGKLRSFWARKGQSFDIETWQYLDSLFFGELEGVDSPLISSDVNYAWA